MEMASAEGTGNFDEEERDIDDGIYEKGANDDDEMDKKMAAMPTVPPSDDIPESASPKLRDLSKTNWEGTAFDDTNTTTNTTNTNGSSDRRE